MNRQRYSLNPKTIAKALEKFGSQRKVAIIYGINISALCQFCRKHSIGKRHEKRGIRYELPMDEIVAEYKSGRMSISALARKHGMSHRGMHLRLQKHVPALRMNVLASRYDSLPWAEIKSMYESGKYTIIDLEKKFGASSDTIIRKLRQYFPSFKLMPISKAVTLAWKRHRSVRKV